MHAYDFRRMRRARRDGARSVHANLVSHEVSALIKMIGRGDTTVADAYLSPVLQRHVGRMRIR